jgi:TrmH family RNA methyltransferase
MIPIHKLMKLPRHQSLRKIGKIFTQAEQEFSGSGKMSFPIEYLQTIADFLIHDTEFSEAAAKELVLAKMGLDQTLAAPLVSPIPTSVFEFNSSLIRSCNVIRHILLAETGQQTADWDFIDHSGNLDAQQRNIFAGMNVYLEDIRSPFNVGSMFRSAESFGVEKVLLSQLCADPNHPRAQRTAMGCVSIVPWQRINLEEIEGPLFVLETGGTNMSDFDFPKHGTMIVGSEELGASPLALELAEKSLGRVTIQTYGAKGSLNAGTAFGIALQAWAEYLATERFPA